MAHDVFISYAHEDKPTADAVCATLESRAVRCWIAPRDILPGSEWSGAIVEAIESAKVMVLVFSSRANASRQISHEVERAVNRGLIIIPFRIEDVAPARNLEYFLSTPHWLDALTPPLEQHLNYLAETVSFLLERGDRPLPQPRASASPILRQDRTVLIGGAGAGVIIIAALLWFTLLSHKSSPSGSSGPAGVTVDPALVGNWQISDSTLTGGGKVDWHIALDADGKYTREFDVKDTGKVAFDSQNTLLMLDSDATPGADITRAPRWSQSGDSVKVRSSSNLAPPAMVQFMSYQGQTETSASWWSGEDTWQRTSQAKGGQVWAGTWSLQTKIANILWQLSLELSPDGNYTSDAHMKDSGSLKAQAGKFSLVSDAFGLLDGDYVIVDKDTAIFKNQSGAGVILQVTWKRSSQSAAGR